jgi:hypothetical protein
MTKRKTTATGLAKISGQGGKAVTNFQRTLPPP